MSLPLSPAVFSILQPLVEEQLGLHYPPADREVFGAKVSARAIEAGFDSLLDYYYYLKYDAGGAAEMAALAEHLVVNETYLFREQDVLEFVVSHLIAAKLANGGRARIWSAACSTGEEPLSLVMLLAARGLVEKVDLVATDISERVLGTARKGVLGRRAIRHALPPVVTSWLTQRPDGSVVVAPSLVERVQWRRLNLVDRAAVRSLGSFDVVLCRNVLIYFNDLTTQRVVENLTDCLTPDGALLVGVSESLLRFGTSLQCEEQGGVFYYRRNRT